MGKTDPVKAEMKNNLFQIMPDTAFDALKPFLEPISLPVRTKLSEAGKPATFVYFPETGLASIVSHSAGVWQEVGIFGREGAGCHMALLTPTVAPYTIFMQAAGHGHRIRSDTVIRLAAACSDLRSVFVTYTHAFNIQISESAVANAQCNITQRLARWLLMAQDRMAQPMLAITHEFLATMLGVGRTGVTLALQELERAELIRTGRKRIEILDRAKLKILTSGTYGFAEESYERVMGSPLPTAPEPALPSRQPSSIVVPYPA